MDVDDFHVQNSGTSSTEAVQLRKVRNNFTFKQFDERWLHELEVICNVEANHVLAGEVWLELSRQPGLMRLLHDEYQLCPFHEFS